MPERCVDASVALKWVMTGEAWRKTARRFLRDSLAANVSLIAPPLFEYETESALQHLFQSRVLALEEADTALARLTAIGVQVVTHPAMVQRAREIARQSQQTRIYDAVKEQLSFVKYLPDYP